VKPSTFCRMIFNQDMLGLFCLVLVRSQTNWSEVTSAMLTWKNPFEAMHVSSETFCCLFMSHFNYQFILLVFGIFIGCSSAGKKGQSKEKKSFFSKNWCFNGVPPFHRLFTNIHQIVKKILTMTMISFPFRCIGTIVAFLQFRNDP
jgi:Na+/H+-dicarboxylate symporter